MPPSAADVAELVRLPAVLSVPGDVLVGAAVSGQGRDVPRTAGLVAASSCLYLAGMALNDYADRDVDAVERPGRPIPSGRVTPGVRARPGRRADRSAPRLLSVAADGKRALAVTVPLAAAVWGYDLALKSVRRSRRQHVRLPRAGRDDGRGRARRGVRGPGRGGRRRAHRGRHRGLAPRGHRRRRRACRSGAGRDRSASPPRARCSAAARRSSAAPPRSGLVGAYAGHRRPRARRRRRRSRRRRACSARWARASSA